LFVVNQIVMEETSSLQLDLSCEMKKFLPLQLD
jgi:hypothetical protein